MTLGGIRRGFIALCAAFLFAAGAAGQTTGTDPDLAPRPVDVQQMLSWLPADTETLIVAKSFALPEMRDHNYSVEVMFQIMPLTTLWLKNGALLDYFRGQRVLVALEGSRRFRSPQGFGFMLFEGCTILVFAEDLGDRAGAFFRSSSVDAFKIEDVDGHKVSVFQEKTGDGGTDTWTTFIAFAKPNLLFVATNLDYLREALSRMRGKSGPRALPEILAQWKCVNTDAQFWGVRHYDRVQGVGDPSSPFFAATGNVFPPWIDDRAVGLTFNFDPADAKRPTMVYMSGNPSVAKAERGPLSMGYEGNKFDIMYRNLDANAIEASYNIRDTDAPHTFFFMLLYFLGHGIFL